MSRLTSEGNVKVWKVPSIAAKAAPTAAEIAAGTHLTPFIPTNGVAVAWTQNNASRPMLDESFTIEAVGTEGAGITLTGLRDDTSDTFWDAFTRGENFFLVIGRFGSADQVGDKVEVYPVESHRVVPSQPAENEFQECTVMLAVTELPELNATVA